MCSSFFIRCLHEESHEPSPRTTKQRTFLTSYYSCNNMLFEPTIIWNALSSMARHGFTVSPQNGNLQDWIRLPTKQKIQGRAVCWQSYGYRVFGIRKVCIWSNSWKGELQILQLCKVQHWKAYELPSDDCVLCC